MIWEIELGWIGWCDVLHWMGRRTNHCLYGCGNLPLADAFYSLEGKLERESSKRTISASGGSGALQMVSEDYVLAFSLFPKEGVDTRRCANKDTWHQRGWIWGRSHIDGRKERVSARTSMDTGPQRGWIWGRSHIDGRKERVSTRTLGPEGGWIVMSHIGCGGE